jgi:hypothetical protein
LCCRRFRDAVCGADLSQWLHAPSRLRAVFACRQNDASWPNTPKIQRPSLDCFRGAGCGAAPLHTARGDGASQRRRSWARNFDRPGASSSRGRQPFPHPHWAVGGLVAIESEAILPALGHGGRSAGASAHVEDCGSAGCPRLPIVRSAFSLLYRRAFASWGRGRDSPAARSCVSRRTTCSLPHIDGPVCGWKIGPGMGLHKSCNQPPMTTRVLGLPRGTSA